MNESIQDIKEKGDAIATKADKHFSEEERKGYYWNERRAEVNGKQPSYMGIPYAGIDDYVEQGLSKNYLMTKLGNETTS